MLNSGRKKNILTLVLSEKKFWALNNNQSLYETLRQNIKHMFIFE